MTRRMTLRHRIRSTGASWRGEAGQTMAEYSVVVGVICVLTVSAFTLLGTSVAAVVQGVLDAWPK